jgi:hypothetical protein
MSPRKRPFDLDLCLIDLPKRPANVMHPAFPSAANAATQVRGKHTDNVSEHTAATGRPSQQSDGLVSGA